MATITSTAAGDWNNTGTWTGSVLPTASDDVILSHIVEANTNITVRTLTCSTNSSAYLNVTSTRSISATAGFLAFTTSTDTHKVIEINGGPGVTVTLNGDFLTGGAYGTSGIATVTGTPGTTVVLNGDIETTNTEADRAALDITVPSDITINGNITNNSSVGSFSVRESGSTIGERTSILVSGNVTSGTNASSTALAWACINSQGSYTDLVVTGNVTGSGTVLGGSNGAISLSGTSFMCNVQGDVVAGPGTNKRAEAIFIDGTTADNFELIVESDAIANGTSHAIYANVPSSREGKIVVMGDLVNFKPVSLNCQVLAVFAPQVQLGPDSRWLFSTVSGIGTTDVLTLNDLANVLQTAGLATTSQLNAAVAPLATVASTGAQIAALGV